MSIYEKGWTSDARFRVAVCGRRFGKTFLAAHEIRRALKNAVRDRIPADHEIWYSAPTEKQSKRLFWKILKKIIPESWLLYRPSESDLSITIGPYGHTVRIVGLDNYNSLRGSGLYFFVGDEWADVRPEVWNEAIRPMLAVSRGHALFMGTPKGHNHFRELYMRGQGGEKQTPGWWSCQYTTEEGGLVEEEEIRNVRKEIDIRLFRQEYEASFENYTGRCVYAFSRDNSVKDCHYDADYPVHIGLDFNINPMCATVWQEKTAEDGSVITYQIDEIVLNSSNTDEISKIIKEKYRRNNIYVYPDPSGCARKTSSFGRTDFSILMSYGMNVVPLHKAPSVRDRLNLTNSMFVSADGRRRAFVSPICIKSIESYERYAYREGSSEPDKRSGYDHLVDASGYYFFTRFGTDKVNIRNIYSSER